MSYRIVIAEDEPDIRSNLARLLTLEDYVVWAAPNGEEALALVREHQPDLLLSDVMMPRMDGHQLIRALRAEPALAHIPAILLTAKAEHRDRREGMNLGADDYLVKPFKRDELLEAVRSRLDRTAVQQMAHQRLQAQTEHLKHFDSLTGLPNRLALLEACERALADGWPVAMAVINMQGVRHINQALGYAGGDEVLSQIAQRLQAHLAQAEDVPAGVYRLSGKQFGMLLHQARDVAQTGQFLGRMAEALAAPYTAQGRDLIMAARLGVAMAQAGMSAQDLLRQAEVALDQEDAGPIAFFNAARNTRVLRRMQLHVELHKALERQQLSLHYQPQVEVASGRIIGFEALMRWQHPELGMVSPAEFIPVAEESDLIIALGNWALGEACRQVRVWQDAGLAPIRMAVNLSSRQFDDPKVMADVARVLEQHALDARLLELEITESVALKGLERTVGTLAAFKERGLSLSIDDFGTGYSSLSYLKRFPVDALKIDQSFVRNIDTDPGDAAIARTVVALAHNFGMSVIAEGVETAAHLACLRDMGCDFAQGYLFSRPVPAEQARALLERGHCSA